MGTSHSQKCNAVYKEIMKWYTYKKIRLTLAYIPGSDNTEADTASWKGKRSQGIAAIIQTSKRPKHKRISNVILKRVFQNSLSFSHKLTIKVIVC